MEARNGETGLLASKSSKGDRFFIKMIKKLTATIYDFQKAKTFSLWMIFIILTYIVLLIKLSNLQEGNESFFFTIYSFAVSGYLLSRFLIAHFYVTDHRVDESYRPTVTFGIPAKNEEKIIGETIARIAKSNYPKDEFDIVAVNDGSTDGTLKEMKIAQKKAEKSGVSVKIIDFAQNKGKRYGMAACARASKNEVIIFVDSDSLVEPDTARELVKFLENKKVGAVTAHTYVENHGINILTKMQGIKYFVAFKAYKAAEAIFGTVTCCSGPCSAYRREYVMKVLDRWLHQKFLGVQCTYGDDRSLTNALLEIGYKTAYSPEASVSTYVPETLTHYKKQQIRWKKSWTRECFRASKFMWRKNPIMSFSFYLTLILTLLAPIVVFRAFIYNPLVMHRLPYYYLVGVLLMSLIYGIYYMIYTNDRKWFWPILALITYSIVYAWLLPYAVLTIKDAKWGTR